MKTILFNVKTTNKEAENLAKTYRHLFRLAVAVILALGFLIGVLISHISHISSEAVTDTHTAVPESSITEDAPIAETPETPASEPEDLQQVAAAFYSLTDEQRTLIEQVVSAESRGEPYEGQVAVAQCILNACQKDDITPERAVSKYKYTSARVEPTASVKEAVAAVFDRGEGVTDEPILYFYAYKRVTSEFHESQDFVIEIKNHRFFKEAA